MALDDLFVVDLKQLFNTQDIHNIFTFQRDDTGAAADLNTAFVADLLPAINNIQNSNIKNVSLKTYNLGNLGDNDERELSGTGADGGADMLPLHDAVNFTLKSTTRAVRPGSKRFAGVSEDYQEDGTITDADYIALLETLRIALDTPVDSGDGDTFSPVIIKRVKYDVPGSDPVRTAYRFPTIGETPVVGMLSAVLVNLHISHQVSRQ